MRSFYILLKLVSLWCFLSAPIVAQAQSNIIDPNAANTPDVSKCSGETELAALIQFTSNGANPAIMTIAMPAGVEYITGSVMTVSQTGGLSVAYSSGPQTAPVFNITAGDGTINAGNEIRLKWRVKASCATMAGTVDFPISLNFNGISSGEVTADILEADLNLTTHPTQAAAIGTPVTVPIQIQNGGLGALDSLDFFITETGMTTQMVMVGSINATLISTMGTTKRYRIYSNALPGGTLNNPESITVMRKVVLTSCTFSSSYATNWGCAGSLCQTPQPSVPGGFSLIEGAPNLTVTSTIITPANTCNNAVVDITFTNNGTGPASAAAAYNNKFNFGMNSPTGWSSANWMAVSVTRGGNAVTFTGGMGGTPITVNGSQFNNAATGGMSDLDLDGQFDDIPQGGSVTFRVTLKYTCPTACIAPSDDASLQAGAMYTDQCGTMYTASGNTAFNFVNNGGGSEVFHPARVSDGDKFNVTVCVQRSFSGGNCPTNGLAFNLNLPPNVMATGVGSINGTAASVTTSGSVATINGTYSGTTICFTLELMYNCGGGPLPFSYEVLYTCDATCSCVQKWGCGNFSILGNGCGPCPAGGLSATFSTATRTTLGFTDHTGTTVVNPATLPPTNLRKGMPCDEFKFTFMATMNGGTGSTAAFNNGFLEFAYDQLAGSNLLQYIAAGSTFDYKDASTGITTTGIALPAPTDVVIGGRHVLVFNFNSFIASLPGGLMANGDMVTACPRFRVLNNPGLTVTPTQPVNPRVVFFNLSTAVGDPLPGGSTRFTCSDDIPEIYLHNPMVIPASISGARMGCGNYLVNGSINHQLTVQGDEYPMEIRPLFRLTSIKVTIQNGDSYDPSFTPQLMVNGSPDDPWYMGSFNLPAPTISGNMLTWTNPGNWPLHDMAGNVQGNTGYNIKFRLRNSGCVNAFDGNLQTVWNYNRFGYGPAGCQAPTTSAAQTGVVLAGAPKFKITNLTGTINGGKEIECFDIKVENTNANPGGYVWLALEDNLSDMDVVSVTNISTNAAVPLLSYTNGKWVRLGTSWAGNFSQTYQVCVKYNNCTNNTMTIKQGWDCIAYPTNPTTYPCTPQLLQANLNIVPREAAIQGDFIATSPVPAQMCQDFTFDIKINSSQQGDILDPRVKVTLPTGMNLQPPISIEYPLNSGNWQVATPTIMGQMVEVQLTNHTLINDSLPGTVSANTAMFPAGEDRQARVRFTMRPTCDYFSGDKITFQPSAERSCGGTATGSGTVFTSSRIRIAGAEPTYEGTFSINFSNNNEITGCVAKSIDVTVQLSDLNAMDGLPAQTGSADTIYITLPAVLDYVPSSYVCTTIPAANCPVFIGTSVIGGRNVLKFKLPANINIPNGGVVPIKFKFDAIPEPNIPCTVTDKITGRVLAVYSNILCPNPAPAIICPKITALAGEGENPLILRKRQFTFENAALACNLSGTINYTIPIRIQNGSIASGETVTAEIYCLDAAGNITGAPVRLLNLVGPIASGVLTTFTGSFGGCDAVNGVKVLIPTTSFAGAFQCQCDMPMFIYRNLLKCPTVSVTVNDNDICANETVTGTAVTMNGASGGMWSTSGTGIFATPNALTSVYTPSAADRTAGMVTLKFTTNDLTGTCPPAMATVTVVIRPLPTTTNSTLTVCANQGSSNGTFNLLSANALIDPVGGNIISYHATLANAQSGASPLSSPYTAANNTVVYARVRNPITGCVNTATLTLRVNPLPGAANAALAVCEDDPVGSGIGTFTLTNASATINNGAGNTITYHNTLADAQSGANTLPGIIISPSRIIFARVVNTATGCVNTAQVTLTVRARPRAYASVLDECPLVFDGLTASFILSQANMQATGGVSGLTVSYHANLFDAQQDINPLPNTYVSVTNNIWIRVEDANGCYSTDILQLVVLENPAIDATATQLTCNGVNNGTATVVVNSGPIPYTYDWSNDGPENPDNDAATITALGAGIYTVTVTDGNGCTATDFVSINSAPAPITITLNSVQNVACNGGSNGAIFITVTGGTPTYSYNWSAPAPDVEDPQSLTAGTYTVTVTDANGCTATRVTTVMQPATALNASTTLITAPTACNASNGSASVTASGGVPGYTYLWSNGQTTNIATGLGSGSYVVTVTDANGCTNVATVNIPFATAPVVVIGSFTNVLCAGGNTGTAMAMVQSGTGAPPFSFLWSNGQTGSNATGLTAGTYGVTATDANGCQGQTSVTILQPTPVLSIITNTKNVSCNGFNDGAATVFGAGGSPAYSYLWSNGNNSPTAINLAPGTYTVTTTDLNGCTSTTTTVITQPAPIVLSIVPPIMNVSCFGGNNGAVNLSVTGGTPVYGYNWSGNAPDVEDPTSLTAGTYTVTVTDNNGCTATSSATVAQPMAPLAASITSFTNTACNGAATGSATVTATGGTTAYTYLWSNGQNAAMATGLAAGSYVVTVTDMNGCTAVATVNIVNPALLQVQIISTSNITCNGLANGTATAGATGGTLPYAYTFRNAANTIIQGPNTNNGIGNLAPGNYSVVVTDANGCTAVAPFVITQPTAVMASITATTPASCFGGSNGTATAAATGGTPGYTFAWPGGFSGPIRTGLIAGNYVVTITDANGCQSTATAVIGQPTAPLSIAPDNIVNVLCKDDATGAIQITVSGGTPNYHYNWSNPAPDVEDPTGLPAGTYNLTVTDINGCTATTAVTVAEPATNVSATISNVVNAQCTGTGTGAATVNPAGGTPGYTYLWSNGQITQTATNLIAGSYVVTVTDANGCTTLATVVITNPTNLSISVVSQTNVQCNGEMTGGATVSATGGTPQYQYEWSNNTFGPVLSGVGVGMYSVTLTDNNGCEAVTSVNITEPTPVIVSIISVDPVSCNGATDGSATAIASGGVGPYTYEWPGAVFGQTITGLAPGTYTVTVRDANNCSMTATAIIPAAPTALSVILANQINVSCFGGNNGSINITVSGGTTNYNYNWSGTTPDVEDPSGLIAGTYTVTITDANGCTVTMSATITQPVAPLTATASGTNPLCSGAADGTATATPAGGTAPYTYLWSNGQNTAMATGMIAGSYVVTVTDANLCQTVTTVVLVNPTAVTASAVTTPIACFGGNNGTATVSPGGGTPGYTYNWLNAANLSVGTAATATGLVAGTYRVTVTDANGCTASTSVTLIQPTQVVANILNTTPVSCTGGNNGTATASASGGSAPYTFTWPGNVSGALRVGLAAGSYIVTATDANGCTATATAIITQPAAPVAITAPVVTNVGCFGTSTGAIAITPTGGTAPYGYDWSAPAPDVEDPNGLPAGSYTLILTDANGCTAQQSFTVTQPTTPVSGSAVQLSNAPCGSTAGSAQANPMGGTAPYTYAWSNGQNTQNATGLIGGSYVVTITDNNGCTTVATVNIDAPGAPSALISSQTPVTCFGGDDGTATVSVTGGTAPYTYNWSGGAAGTTTRTGLSAGSYFVTVSDASIPACSVVASVVISQPTDLVENVLLALPISCAGATNGVGTVLASGGTSPYTYTWPGNLTGATQTGLAAGTYSVTATDANGCTETVDVVIGSNGQLNLNVLPNLGPLCPGETVPLTILGSQPVDPATIYSWSGGLNAGLANGTASGLSPNIPAFTASNTEGNYTVTVSANLMGCTTTRVFSIEIIDNTPPQFACPQQMIMVGNDADLCSAKVNWAIPDASDDCGTVSVNQTGGPVSGSALSVGLHTITYVANDGRGNTSECAFQILVLDTQAPVITCPSAPIGMFSLLADANCTYTQTANAWNASAADNCNVVSLTHNYAAAPSNTSLNGATFPLGNTTVTWTAADLAGHTTSCAFTVLISDKTAPTVTAGTCPSDIMVSNDDDVCGAAVTYQIPTFNDHCDGVNLAGTQTSGLASGAIFPVGATTVTYTYTDAAGNAPAVCTFIVQVEDTQAPVITCPANLTVGVDGTLSSANANSFTLIGTGPCGVTLSYTPPVGMDNCSDSETDLMSGLGAGANYYAYNGTYTHEWRVTDASGNSASCAFTIKVEDPIAPIITCPANTTIATDPNECTAVVTYALPISGDNCPGFTINQLAGPASGEEFALGTTTVAFQVADNMGNATTCSFTVTVRDMQKPAPVCPPARDVLTSTGIANDCQGLVPDMLAELLAGDNCTPTATLLLSATQTPVGNTTFGVSHNATQIVTFTVTDLAGNSQTCTTVLTLKDDELPTVDCTPTTRTVNANANCSFTATGPQFDPAFTDNCNAVLSHNNQTSPNANTLAGTTFPIGNTVVNFTTTDAAGNSATCSITIQVVDNQLPTFVNCPANITVNNDVDQCGRSVVFPTPVANDNCGATVALIAPSLPSGSVFPSGPTAAGATSTVIFRATDAAGNSTDCVFTVTVLDKQMPKAICTDFTVNLSATGSATITPANINGGSTDNCTTNANLSLLASQTVFDCSDEGLNYVTLTVTDQAGNVNNCVATVTVNDITPPSIICPANMTVSNCSSPVPNVAALTTATDACGISTITQNPVPGVLFGQNQGNSLSITLTATDVNGNTSTCLVSVTVNDNVLPTLSCPANTTISADPGKCEAAVTYSIPTAADNCPGVVLSNQTPAFPSGALFPIGLTTVIFRAIDAAGNAVTCSFNITVVDMQPPTAVCQNMVVDLSTSGTASITAAQVNGGSTDNCPASLTYALSNSNFTCANVGQNNVTLTVTDGAGNTSICVATITVRDVTPPTFTCPPAMTVDGCNDLVPDVITGITNEADACGVASTVQNPVAGLDFGQTNGNAVNITVTVTDVNGNVTTCVVPVTINDDDEPDFLNCPTSMVMIGNDPDQCSGKVNWQPPVAVDDCIPLPISAPGNPSPGTVVQTTGPIPGTAVAITCPPTPTTITYVATDGAGNQSTCTFQIMVVDTQKPEFDADILMPGNVTVNCDAVPTNCIPRTGGACTPLTNNDVNDNCTAAANLTVAFNEVSTQNPNPAVCGHYNYTLTRTWTVTDCAGNSRQHTQVIDVNDTTKPTALCKNITITLDANGKASITAADVNNGSFDNCAAPQFLTYTVTPNLFTCANLGPNTVTLTVTDPCGNFSTCTAIVTVVQGIASCTPQYTVVTNCLDNATNENNGQFEDLITVKSLAMQTWTLAANSSSNGQGLYAANSPAPPAAPVLLAIGTAFTAGTADGIDNDNDGATDEVDEAIYYTLRGRFTECVGYTITIGNAGNFGMAPSATTATIANKACYPNPYFTNLNDPFCLYTPPFAINVGEYNNAQGTVINVMVNGVATTTFDAAALGEGFHTVMATFDAGTATQNLVINGVQVGGSMQDAINDPGCKQKITKVVQVVGTPTQVTCNDLVTVSLDADCKETINADDVLEGTYYCYDDYTVEVDRTAPFGNGPWTMAMFTSADIGKTYFYRVTHAIGGNMCWGEIKVEDKLIPALTCPANITIACSESTAPAHTGQVGIQDCSATTTVVDDDVLDNGECGNPRQVITRTFIVTDTWGNQATCQQVITVIPFNFADLILPADITINCESAYLNPAATQPNATGRPSINGAPIGQGTLCSASIGYSDQRLEICAGSYEILRKWIIRNTCLPISANNPIEYTQVIRVKDFGGPQFVCPPAVTVSTDPFNCCATAALPDMIVSEGCSFISDLEAKVTGTNPVNGNIITFTVPGSLHDFPGNNIWNPDTLARFAYTQCLPIGDYNVQYSAADQCGNISKCNFVLSVADLIPPTTTCTQVTKVSIITGGEAIVDATVFDQGTTDNCCLAAPLVRRMVDGPCDNDTEEDAFAANIKFCCADLGDTVMVVFRAFDCHGNYNDCMVNVLVEDKIKPVCTPPANVTVNCEAFDPSLWTYGIPEIVDNCCLDTSKVYQGQVGLTHMASYTQFDTVCNRGTITRTFRAFDCNGQSSQCTQRVVVTYKQDYFVRFPDDVLIMSCNSSGVYGTPTFFGENCELLATSYTDELFTVVPDACFKIERVWKVINWCTYNPNQPCTNVPNPNPNINSMVPVNLPGPIVSPAGTPAPWAPTIAAITPGAQPTNFSTFWTADVNCYTYKQIIKVIDTEAPVAVCPTSPVEFCDLTANNDGLWNEMYYWDNRTESHDLCEGPSDLTLTATDSCSGANINIEYLLFLDLDGNGSMETVVNSKNLPGYNRLNFNNANNPNFSGGTPYRFDQRPVPLAQQYGFTIQRVKQGNNLVASVRWNTVLQPNNYVIPELPYGTHKIKWFITDGCGNNKECEYTFVVKDCKKPTVVCLNGLSVNIMPTQTVSLWANDFLQYTEDNCTPTPKLKLGIVRSEQSTGSFPVDGNGNPITGVLFNCDDTDPEPELVQLWSIDLAGNADFCETYVLVQDNMGNCDPNGPKPTVAGHLKTESGEGLEGASIDLQGSMPAVPPLSMIDDTDENGKYEIFSVPLALNVTITPVEDDNHINGVSTYDLVLISKHILGIEPLTSPYKMIAADANKSGSITTFDIVELRKLILGVYTELPNNTSWRFVDKAYSFPNPSNPFANVFPENKTIAEISTSMLSEDFVSVKVGDLNGNAVANALMQSEDRSAGVLYLNTEDREVKSGETFEISLSAAQNVQGYQLTLNHAGLEILDVTGIKSENFAVHADAVTLSVDGSQTAATITLKVRATQGGKLSRMLGVSSRITKAEGYNAASEKLDIALRYNNSAVITGLPFELYQNVPNPFISKTVIGFHLPEAATATLKVYDESGRVLLTQKGDFAKGYNQFSLDRQLLNTTGLLYYTVETATDKGTKLMIQAK